MEDNIHKASSLWQTEFYVKYRENGLVDKKFKDSCLICGCPID